MNLQQMELYQRIQDFALDEPTATYPFSQRLARENQWSAEYTQRAIAEYKKFAFLAVAAGHPVSPPKPIDQVWHLHLIYTRSYWGEFCPKILQKDFHHEPSQGGRQEVDKFADWYDRTLNSYQAFFGETPPTDIWTVCPSPQKKRSFAGKFPLGVGLFAIAFTLTACQPNIGIPILNDALNLPGPEFLLLYIGVASLAFAIAWVWRWLWIHLHLSQPVPNLDPYEIAYLAQGHQRTVETAIAHLVQQGYLKVDRDRKCLEVEQDLPENSHPLEQRIVELTREQGKIWYIRSQSRQATDAIAQRLENLGLIFSAERATAIAFTSVIPIGLTLLFGVSKIFIGLVRSRPVGYLTVLCFLTLIIGIFFLTLPLTRRPSGDTLLETIRTQYAANPEPELLGVALTGPVSLANTQSDLFFLFLPPASPSSSRYSSSSSSSSCGGGGCGGGGCGGGCGGCGGCGG